MADMGLSGGFAAGQGADALQELLKQAFLEETTRARTQQEQQRIALEAERNRQQAEMQKAQLASIDEARKAAAQEHSQGLIKGVLSMTPAGSTLDPAFANRAREMGFNIHHDAADLPSTAMSGIAQTGPAAPMVGSLRMAATGRPERDTFGGTAEQQAADQARKEKQGQIDQARQDKIDAAKQAALDRTESAAQSQADRQENLRLAATLRPATQPALVTIQTVDDQGNPVTKIVPKTAGQTFAKPVGSTMESRLASAKAVKQTGEDMVAKLSDPTVQAALGPVLGRYTSLREFLGNPPPQYAELAGQIESYALANMGVHGMRSAQGAEQIKKLLDAHHTPASLAATIRGLNSFSQHFLENAGKEGAVTSKPSGFTVTEIK